MKLRWRNIAVYLWRIVLTTLVALVTYDRFLSVPDAPVPAPTVSSSASISNSLAPMLKKVIPAVVNITTIGVESTQSVAPSGQRIYLGDAKDNQPRQFRSLGSGVIVDAERGYIITNYHVVEDAQQIEVVLNDERQTTGRLLGSDPDTDVALIKIDSKDLVALPFGDSSALEVGDFVVAVGNPFGLRHSVSLGIVSALGRYGISNTPGGIEDYIQTDAPINPGNSGGALVNNRGQLVGINTSIYSEAGSSSGIGFAIPSAKLQSITEQLLTYGQVRRGTFGVVTEPLNDALRLRLRLPASETGMVVTAVDPGSLADKTGILAGDIIAAINGTPIDSQQTLRNTTGLLLAGETFTINVKRDGQLISYRTRFPAPQPSRQAGDFIHPKLTGAEFRDLPLAERVGPAAGVLVHSVRTGTSAWHANLRPGDVILQVNGQFISGLGPFTEVLRNSGKELYLLVQSGQKIYRVTIH